MTKQARSRRQNPEEQVHAAVVRHLRARAVPGVVWFHPPNGGKRGVIAAARLKRMGVRAGVADLIILFNGVPHALELKAAKGRLSEAQRTFIYEWRKAGGIACVAQGLDEALAFLVIRGIIRKVGAFDLREVA